MDVYYPGIVAGDAASVSATGTVRAVVTPNAVYQVYELDDKTFSTPLTIKTPAGLTDTKVPVGDLPIFPDVYVVSPNYSHIWKSGDLVFRRDSGDAKDKAVATAVAAAQAAVAEVPAKIQEALASGDYRGPAGAVSSLTIGTVKVGSTAAATITGSAGSQVLNLVFPPNAESHNTAPSYANAPAGSTFTIVKTANGWPNRYSDRADLVFIWQGAEPSPPIVASGTTGMRENDVRVVRGPVGA